MSSQAESTVGALEVIGERTELPKPLTRTPPIASPDQHKMLRAALKKHAGMSDRAAGAVSTIWADPADIILQVANPQRRRVPGAYLKVISGRAYTSRLCPDWANPRNFDKIVYPVAGS